MSFLNNQTPSRPPGWRALVWRAITWGGLGLGTVGALLPLLPTTPFLLIAAWAAPKGSPRLNDWLHRHPMFGPVLEAWRAGRAVPAHAKCAAIALMASSWIGLWMIKSDPLVLFFTGVLFCAVAAFLLSRPTVWNSTNEHIK